jgi:signal transduction histidine kinase
MRAMKMRIKLFPLSLFGISMLVISVLFFCYALITGILSYSENQQQQINYLGAQIENALIKHEKNNIVNLTPPAHILPIPSHIEKIFILSNPAIVHDFKIYYEIDNPHTYWLYNDTQGWIKVYTAKSLLTWLRYAAFQLGLMIEIIILCAWILSHLIKKQITRFEEERQLVLAGIAHDIATPLTRIQLNLEMIKDLDPNKKQSLINDIEQINYLKQQFLNYISAKKKHNTQYIDLAGLLENCAEQYPKDAIQLTIPEDSVYIKANARQLQRAFDNVLANAFNYGKPPVEILMQVQNKHVIVTITDHGEGVPDELLSQITEPFYRVNAARSNCEGTGLGLAIFIDVIKANGGKVKLRNAPNAGLQIITTMDNRKPPEHSTAINS